MTLNVDLLLRRQCYAYCDETAKARITQFSQKVALYLNYLHIKFDDEILRESLRISSIIFDLRASKVNF